MKIENIDIKYLSHFIGSAFWNDNELLSFYDKNIPVKTIEDICDNVYEKIKSLNKLPQIRGVVSEDGLEIGYFIFEPTALISFGININYRNKENLMEFWELIKKEIGVSFQCYLFGHNTRAIKWLQKSGMNIIFENVTILELCH